VRALVSLARSPEEPPGPWRSAPLGAVLCCLPRRGRAAVSDAALPARSSPKDPGGIPGRALRRRLPSGFRWARRAGGCAGPPAPLGVPRSRGPDCPAPSLPPAAARSCQGRRGTCGAAAARPAPGIASPRRPGPSAGAGPVGQGLERSRRTALAGPR